MKSLREQFFDAGRLRALETTVKAEIFPVIKLPQQIDLSIEQKRSRLEELQKKKFCVLERMRRKTEINVPENVL